ncbi:hypothetical protein COCNU_15G006270 [Cocos nucifera]|uniref:Uncharacterized protein n=1 Tax=Cocos nucifera TaxID=13894 RepID=A0A8K0IY77_COCNU|nr:hypothetical protein COCNU_15G006270 [Cocos nucifera]
MVKGLVRQKPTKKMLRCPQPSLLNTAPTQLLGKPLLRSMAHDITISYEEHEKKYQEKITLLDIELGTSRNKTTNLKEEFEKLKADFQKEMESMESTLIEERDKGVELVKKLSAVELAAKTWAQEAASRALANWKSKEYEGDSIR